jgi:hypothetical protein
VKVREKRIFQLNSNQVFRLTARLKSPTPTPEDLNKIIDDARATVKAGK